MQREREPVFNAPTVVVLTLAVFALVHLARNLLDGEDDALLVWTLAFVPGRYGADGVNLPGYPWAAYTSFVTHMLVHGDLTHLGLNSAWLLAFGSLIARRLGAARFLIVSIVCGVVGALTFLAFNIGRVAPMIGASGAISGLMSAAFLMIFAVEDPTQRWLLRHHPADCPRLALSAALTDRRLLLTIASWVGINALMAYGLGSLAAAGSIAWEAHIGGFFAGFLVFALLDRGPILGRSGPVHHRLS